MLKFRQYTYESSEDAGKYEIAKTPLEHARKIVNSILLEYNSSIEKEFPNFDENYLILKDRLVNSWGMSRRDMPVISPSETSELMSQLKKGGIDLLTPFGAGVPMTQDDIIKNPNDLDHVTLHFMDKKSKGVKAVYKKILVSELKPIQEQVYLDKVIKNVGKYGAKATARDVPKLKNIVSQENYILDGHHRYASLMLINPNLKQDSLYIPLPMREVLDLTLAFGDQIGNERNK